MSTKIPISALKPAQKRQFWAWVRANRPALKHFLLYDYPIFRRQFGAALRVDRDDVRSALQ